MVARAAVIAICMLIIGSGAFLLIGRSLAQRTSEAQVQVQRRQAAEGRLLIVTDEGATCQQLSFDNNTGQIVNVHKGTCREAGWPQAALEADSPLGSIRKALNGH